MQWKVAVNCTIIETQKNKNAILASALVKHAFAPKDSKIPRRTDRFLGNK
jgi:hypothetical protein